MILALALLLAAADPPPPPAPPTLLQRIQQRFAADPARAQSLGHLAPQMQEAAWLIGTWYVSVVVEEIGGPPQSGTSVIAPQLSGAWLEIRDNFPGGTESRTYVGYSAVEGNWVAIGLDNQLNANRATAPGWTGGRIAFEGDFVILGVPAHLRETIEGHGADEFQVVVEEPAGGTWRRIATRYYRRHPARS